MKYTKMRPKVKKEWIAALRSGDYIQGTEQLRSPINRFCCLGVLCNLHAMHHPDIAKHELDSKNYLDHDSDLPTLVGDWAGICVDYPDEVQTKLVNLNDSEMYSFEQIADWIEKNL